MTMERVCAQSIRLWYRRRLVLTGFDTRTSGDIREAGRRTVRDAPPLHKVRCHHCPGVGGAFSKRAPPGRTQGGVERGGTPGKEFPSGPKPPPPTPAAPPATPSTTAATPAPNSRLEMIPARHSPNDPDIISIA